MRAVDLFAGVVGACLAVALGIVAVSWISVRRASTDAVGGPFQLVDGTGHGVTERSWPGKYLLVYFGYTSCPDICPTTLSGVSDALKDLGRKADEIQPLFITVDPHRDTPEVLDNYTRLFDPRLVGLTGTDAHIAQAAREYRVYFAFKKTGTLPGQYVVDHSSVLYLMSPDGHFLATIDPSLQAKSLADQISARIS